MSKTVVQLVEQKRLTNVAVVRLKKQGNCFEITCYKNKVVSWRSSVEKDIDEVLQSHTIYSNVSKGFLAKSKDLIKVFRSDNHTKMYVEFLDKSELQIAEQKRESRFSSQFSNFTSLLEKLKEWEASVVSKDESGTQMSTVCEMEPGLFRGSDPFVRNMQGRLEILDVSLHAEGDTSIDHYDEHNDMALQTNKTLLPDEAETDPIVELIIEIQK